MTQSIPRRKLLTGAGRVAGAAVVGGLALPLRATTRAQESRVVVGVIGVGGMGTHHVRNLARRDDVEVAYICDVDQRRHAVAAGEAENGGQHPGAVTDLRRVLDDARVDAVFIATPDHWHVPAALLALQAGKHVYVEKPCSHNVREGRLLVEAAARAQKHVQVGTQSRSTACVKEAIDRVHAGEIGEVLVAKAWNSQGRTSIGKSSPTQPPPELDFDQWLGPAPLTPYRPNLLPAIWRWWRAFGCGDMGNDGVHDLDVALWGLGATAHPDRVACLGGKYHFDDDQEHPDTQYAVFEYPGKDRPQARKQLIFEQRIWSPYVQEGYENGAAFYGTKGMLVLGHSVGWKLYGERNRLLAERTGSPDLPSHHTNFLDCVRGKSNRPNADASVGHRAATLVHLGNLAARFGRVLQFDPVAERIVNDPEAEPFVRRAYREGHWAVPRGV